MHCAGAIEYRTKVKPKPDASKEAAATAVQHTREEKQEVSHALELDATTKTKVEDTKAQEQTEGNSTLKRSGTFEFSSQPDSEPDCLPLRKPKRSSTTFSDLVRLAPR